MGDAEAVSVIQDAKCAENGVDLKHIEECNLGCSQWMEA